MPRILYPTLIEPVGPPAQQPEQVTESRWHQPFSNPVRRGSFVAALAAGALVTPIVVVSPAAYEASLEVPVRSRIAPRLALGFVPFVQTAEPVTADRWVQGLGVPVRRLYTTPDDVSYAGAPPFPEAVTADRWVQGFGIPRRASSADKQPTVSYLEAPPFPEATSVDRWHQPFGTPRRATSADRQPAFTYSSALPYFDVSWHRPLADPVRAKLLTREGYILVKADPFAELVSADRWIQGFGVPTRRPYAPPGHIGYVESDPFPELVSADRWAQPFGLPRLVVSANKQPAFSYSYALPQLATGWYQPLSDAPRAVLRQSTRLSYVAQVDQPVAPISIGWYQPLSTTGIAKFLPKAALSFIKSAPFPEGVTADRWAQGLSLPARAMWRQSASLSYVFQVDQPTPVNFGWCEPLSAPFRSITRQYAAFTYGHTLPQLTMDWRQPLSGALARIAQRQLASSNFVSRVVPETITADKWLAELARPVRLPRVTLARPTFVAPSPFADTPFRNLALPPARLASVYPNQGLTQWPEASGWWSSAPDSAPRRLGTPWDAAFTYSYLPTPPETITPDKWYAALGQPVLLSRALDLPLQALWRWQRFITPPVRFVNDAAQGSDLVGDASATPAMLNEAAAPSEMIDEAASSPGLIGDAGSTSGIDDEGAA